MRRCRINLPNRCYHLISRVAHRALEFGGLQAANRKGRYDKEKLLWQFTVAIKSDPVVTKNADKPLAKIICLHWFSHVKQASEKNMKKVVKEDL